MEIKVPELSLVVLIGVSGSGKSSFAKKHFKRTEILSSDECRALVSDDENSQSATNDAFDVLYYIAGKRLKSGLLTVIDATNLTIKTRKTYFDIAKKYNYNIVGIVFDFNKEIILKRTSKRTHFIVQEHVIHNMFEKMKDNTKSRLLDGEPFSNVYLFNTEKELEKVQFTVHNYGLELDKFDIIGDVHGCYNELTELLKNLGYDLNTFTHPDNRKVIFVGDICDRGYANLHCFNLVKTIVL